MVLKDSQEVDNTLLDRLVPDDASKIAIIELYRNGDTHRNYAYIEKKYDVNPVQIQASIRKFFDWIGYWKNGELKVKEISQLYANLIFYIKREQEDATKASDPKWQFNHHLKENVLALGFGKATGLDEPFSGDSMMLEKGTWKYQIDVDKFTMLITDPAGKHLGTIGVGVNSGVIQETTTMANFKHTRVGRDDLH